MKVLFADSIYWEKLGAEFRSEYERVVTNSYKEVRKLLPDISGHVNFLVQPREYDLIDETQDNGYTVNSELILLSFHPEPKKGLKSILDHLKPTIYHELNHAARYNQGIWHETLIEQAIMEGLATAFERDYANATPLWGEYKKEDVKKWLKEIKSLGANFNWDDYMYKHPDGRKWIGYKTGTYIVDEASKLSRKSIIELTKLSCEAILSKAMIDPR